MVSDSDKLEPAAWRYREIGCRYCENGGWEFQEMKPEKVKNLWDRDTVHAFQYDEDEVKDIEPLVAVRVVVDRIDQLLERQPDDKHRESFALRDLREELKEVADQ